jgi:hypothetical protein
MTNKRPRMSDFTTTHVDKHGDKISAIDFVKWAFELERYCIELERELRECEIYGTSK